MQKKKKKDQFFYENTRCNISHFSLLNLDWLKLRAHCLVLHVCYKLLCLFSFVFELKKIELKWKIELQSVFNASVQCNFNPQDGARHPFYINSSQIHMLSFKLHRYWTWNTPAVNTNIKFPTTVAFWKPLLLNAFYALSLWRGHSHRKTSCMVLFPGTDRTSVQLLHHPSNGNIEALSSSAHGSTGSEFLDLLQITFQAHGDWSCPLYYLFRGLYQFWRLTSSSSIYSKMKSNSDHLSIWCRRVPSGILFKIVLFLGKI